MLFHVITSKAYTLSACETIDIKRRLKHMEIESIIIIIIINFVVRISYLKRKVEPI